ncbi:MAG: hypothetical protein D6702_09620 [Planctomycetota bacterium]|nr:MAG: hypothetical protein D6702_09620 [Planctomycetota bacterium]
MVAGGDRGRRRGGRPGRPRPPAARGRRPLASVSSAPVAGRRRRGLRLAGGGRGPADRRGGGGGVTGPSDLSARIRAARRILLSGHQRADGDCLGSLVLLARSLAVDGRRTRILLPDEPDPRLRDWPPGRLAARYRPGEALPEHDLLLVCDTSSLARLGALAEPVRASGRPRACIDHHPLAAADRGDWDLLCHDPAAPATGLLAWRLAATLGLEPDAAACEAAFLALAADTGWFRHANTSPEVWALAAELVGRGVDSAALYRRVWQRLPAAAVRGVGLAAAGFELRAGGRLALAAVGPERLAAAGAELADADEVLDLLRSVAGVEVVAVVHARAGRVRASLRSRGPVDVNEVARSFGGGGHRNAAGLTWPPGTDPAAAAAALADRLETALAAVGGGGGNP